MWIEININQSCVINTHGFISVEHNQILFLFYGPTICFGPNKGIFIFTVNLKNVLK